MNRNKTVGVAVAVLLVLVVFVWLAGSKNPGTPAGYVGYLTRGAVFGKTTFVGLQTGPTSPGRGWLLAVDNVSITPYTYTEPFIGTEAVLAKNDLMVQFKVHLVFRIKPQMVREFFEKYSVLYHDRTPDKVVEDAYKNYLKEPLRTSARDNIQALKALDIKDNIKQLGQTITQEVKLVAKDTPFEVISIVVGNIQYP